MTTIFTTAATKPVAPPTAPPTDASRTPTRLVSLGECSLTEPGLVLETVLGSCVGLYLHHPRHRVGALAHVVLPRARGLTELPGKFADTALPHLLKLLEQAGVPRFGLVVKAVGGADMFRTAGPLQVGVQNIAAIRALLAEARLPLVAEHLGGAAGRRVQVIADTGEVHVQLAKHPPLIL